MSREMGRYDTSLNMFVEDKVREPDINHLKELRWRVENGKRFGHPEPMSTPKGEYLFKLSDVEIFNYAKKGSTEQRLRAYIAESGGK